MIDIDSADTAGTLEEVKWARANPFVVTLTAYQGVAKKVIFHLRRDANMKNAQAFMHEAMQVINKIIDDQTITHTGHGPLDMVAYAVRFAVKTYGDCAFSINVCKEGDE